MPCYHPVNVGILRKSANGETRTRDSQDVPCGSCLGCRAEQSRQWSVRIMHEAQEHDNGWFVTLTYDDYWMPEHGSLDPEDFRRFIKSLRRSNPEKDIRYFGCGEYGDKTQRPHYHAVLFGVDFLDKRPHSDPNRDNVWRSESLDRYWRRGLTEFSPVTRASASYVAGYVNKKVKKRVNGEPEERLNPFTGEIIEIEPEFTRMSLRPALGKRWIERWWRDVYPRDFVVVDGKEYKPPRYYDKWMDQYHPKSASCGFGKSCPEHWAVMADVREQRIAEGKMLDVQQLRTKERIHERRQWIHGRKEVF